MKFKIWNNILEHFVDDSGFYINTSGEIFFEDVMDSGLIRAIDDTYKVLRYTELHDLNGQELYEGDIVKLYYHHDNITTNQYTIRYGSGRWMLDEWECLSNLYLDNTKKYGDVCKVVKVGNILENQKLSNKNILQN